MFSIVCIIKNASKTISNSINSIQSFSPNLICLDNYSTDNSVEVAESLGAKVYRSREKNFGKLKQFIISKAKGEWVLVLDTDEVVSLELSEEIKAVISGRSRLFDGYRIPYRNHCLGQVVSHGGENYHKLILFRNDKGHVDPAWIHEEVEVDGKVGELMNYMDHYSYRSIRQIITKFTGYARRAARQAAEKGEKVTLKKLFLYGPHMVWSRFVSSQGFLDGWRGLLLALAFGYMEQLTYVNLLLKKTDIE